jgi:hypothetical protein
MGCFLTENGGKKMEKLSSEELSGLSEKELMYYAWDLMGAISTLPREDIRKLTNHLMESIKKGPGGEEKAASVRDDVIDFLYPSPHMLAWAETRLKKRPEMTPTQLAKQYAGVVMKNKKMAPSLIRDMQKLKARLAIRKKRDEWARLSGRKIKRRMMGPKARVPANAAYWDKVNTPARP